MLHILILWSFLLLSSIPWYGYTTVYLFTSWWTFELLPFLGVLFEIHCCEHLPICLSPDMHSFLLGKYLGVQFLGDRVNVCLTYLKNSLRLFSNMAVACFIPKRLWVLHFTWHLWYYFIQANKNYLFIYLGSKEMEREYSYLLVLSSNAYNSWGWARAKANSQESNPGLPHGCGSQELELNPSTLGGTLITRPNICLYTGC